MASCSRAESVPRECRDEGLHIRQSSLQVLFGKRGLHDEPDIDS